jgi:signal transduction histidine kinase
MAREIIAGVELESAIGRFPEDTPRSGRQLMVDGKERPAVTPESSGDIEKTAHDFRASLNIIIGFTELMLGEVTGKINAEQRRSLNDILNSGKRLLDLSDDIIKRLETASENKK